MKFQRATPPPISRACGEALPQASRRALSESVVSPRDDGNLRLARAYVGRASRDFCEVTP